MDAYGPQDGPAINDEVLALVKEAIATPIEWGNMTLVEGVNDIMARFSAIHPELTATRSSRLDAAWAGFGGSSSTCASMFG